MEKKQIQISDFDEIKQISLKIYESLIAIFPETKSDLDFGTNDSLFPKRWKYSYSNYNFEWVVSEMGSITLRLGEHPRFRKNPPPIFYLSLGKYDDGFYWEDLDGAIVLLQNGTIQQLVSEKINLFIESETNL